MWMDSSNKVSQEEVIAPLSHDITGAFSRSGKPITKEKFDPEWLDTLLVTLYVFFICAVDLILFAGSGNLQVFDGSMFPVGEVSVILGGIALFSIIAVVPFHIARVQRMAKHISAALITVLIVYVVFRQFFQYYQQYAVGTYMVPLSVFVAFFLGGVAFAFFEQDKPLYRILFVVAVGVLFLNVYTTYHNNPEHHEFIETRNKQKDTLGAEKRLVYLLLPNLTSYAYISSINTPEALKTRDIIQGFYQKHNFKVYSKAYVPDFVYPENVVRTLNPSSEKSSKQHVMSSQLLDKYWRFYNPKNEYVHLQDNELYDHLKREKYKISAYKSRDIDMCRKMHKYNVSRCVEKVNRPIDLHTHGMSLGARTGVLAMEWLTSMHLFGDISTVYKFINKLVNLNYVPITHIDFSNLYVVDSFKTLDVVFSDMKKDTGKQAYFVFMDLPSNMYVYDEYCRIQDRSQWQSMINMPWVTTDKTAEKQKAYLQQSLCLYGKLEQFLENMEDENMLQDTVVIIQGVSGVHDFKPDSAHTNPLGTFVGDKSVVMAIYDNRMPNKEVDDRLCSANQILAEYLFPNQKCQEHLEGYHSNIADGISKRLTNLTQNIKNITIANFEEWYRNWRKTAGGEIGDALIMKPSQSSANTDDEEDDEFGIDDLHSSKDNAQDSATSAEASENTESTQNAQNTEVKSQPKSKPKAQKLLKGTFKKSPIKK